MDYNNVGRIKVDHNMDPGKGHELGKSNYELFQVVNLKGKDRYN